MVVPENETTHGEMLEAREADVTNTVEIRPLDRGATDAERLKVWRVRKHRAQFRRGATVPREGGFQEFEGAGE